MDEVISRDAVTSMLKHAIHVFENDTSVRRRRLRGISNTTTGYRIHLLSMSQYFGTDDAKLVCGTTFRLSLIHI